MSRLVSTLFAPVLLLALASPARAELDPAAQRSVARLAHLAEAGEHAALVREARKLLKSAQGEAADAFAYHLALGLSRTGEATEAVEVLIPLVEKGTAQATEAAALLKQAAVDLPDENLAVGANVEGAEVLVDGESWGSTPLETKVKPGVYALNVNKEGFAPQSRRVSILPGHNTSLTFELTAHGGTLVVEADAQGLTILLDGVAHAPTGLTTTLAVPPREVKVALTRGQEVLASEVFDFTLGGTQTMTLRSVALVNLPQATEARVLVDGQPVKPEGGVLRLAQGPHKLRLEKSGFRPVEGSLSAEPGHDLTVTAEFLPVEGHGALVPWLWAGTGTGAALLATSVVLYQFTDLEGGGNDALLWGLGGAGVALFSGSALWLSIEHDRTHNPPVHQGGLKLSLVPAPAGAALVGAF
jgi:hypothetical protein